MTRENILRRLRQIAKEELGSTEAIDFETSLHDGLGFDSVQLVELIISLEEEYQIAIPDEEVETFKTVGQLVDFIIGKKNV